MKVNYRFEYQRLDEAKKDVYSIVLPIEVTPETDADSMFSTIVKVLKDQRIVGKPLFAHSTLKQFPSYCFSTTEDEFCDGNKQPSKTGRRVWCLVDVLDETEPSGTTTWIPGIEHSDGTVSSVLGMLSNPESPDDIRPFDDCPFPEYSIQKKGMSEKTATVDPRLCSTLAIVYPETSKPFLYQVTLAVNPSLSVQEQLEALEKKVYEMINGNCTVVIYRYKILSVFSEQSYPEYENSNYTAYVETTNLEIRALIVSVLTASGDVMNVLIPMPQTTNLLFSQLHLWLTQEIRRVLKRNLVRITNIQEDNDIAIDLPIILPEIPIQ